MRFEELSKPTPRAEALRQSFRKLLAWLFAFFNLERARFIAHGELTALIFRL